MKQVQIEVAKDHLDRLINCQPVDAVAELIWNALDAEANNIDVVLDKRGGVLLERITVTDDGTGIDHDLIDGSLHFLGGSWKRDQKKTTNGLRILHGQKGQGRFKAFSLGDRVEWNTVYGQNGSKNAFSMFSTRDNLKVFTVTDPAPSKHERTGTEVIVTYPDDRLAHSDADNVVGKLSEEFALYLTQFPGIKITYDGIDVDPSRLWKWHEEIAMEDQEIDGKLVKWSLYLIEWVSTQERAMLLCDPSGIMLHRVDPQYAKTRTPGFNYTAYLKSEYFSDLQKANQIEIAELNKHIIPFIEISKKVIKDVYIDRRAVDASEKVDEWKKIKIYPYESAPQGKVEEAERKLFDVVAITVNDHLKDFDESPINSKKLTLNLLKQALQESPDSLQRILEEVLKLNKNEQSDLASLLLCETTSLSNVITAAKTVADRLNFLKIISLLVFDFDLNKKIKERSQLHKILEKETWIFGEQFTLSVSDKDVDEVLRKHENLLGREDSKPKKRKSDEAGPELSKGAKNIVDLMLSRRIPQPRREKRHHLVVELKRPSQKINGDVIQQIKRYAKAVSDDPRFKGTDTQWDFLAVSTDYSDDAVFEDEQTDRPSGLIINKPNLRVWIKRWNEVIDDCSGRLSFFQEKLQYEADDDSAWGYLEEKHGEIFGLIIPQRNSATSDASESAVLPDKIPPNTIPSELDNTPAVG